MPGDDLGLGHHVASYTGCAREARKRRPDKYRISNIFRFDFNIDGWMAGLTY
jgi:hypothetical protein